MERCATSPVCACRDLRVSGDEVGAMTTDIIDRIVARFAELIGLLLLPASLAVLVAWCIGWSVAEAMEWGWVER